MSMDSIRSRLASLYAQRTYTLRGWGILLFFVVVALAWEANEKVKECNDQGGSAGVAVGTSGISVECRIPRSYSQILH